MAMLCARSVRQSAFMPGQAALSLFDLRVYIHVYSFVSSAREQGVLRRLRRRRPERTPLDRAVQGHLETYLALAREGHFDAEGVPAYVEREFRRHLECGILARGLSARGAGRAGASS